MPAEMLAPLISLPLYALVPLLAVALLLTRRVAQHLPEKRINGVPLAPLVPDWIPFIGNALMLAQGDKMWAGLMRRYGPAFRVRAMGDVRTFVCTYELINHVYKYSKSFDFFQIRKHMAALCFGAVGPDAFDPIWDDTIFPQHHRGMQPGALQETIHRYVGYMEDLVQDKVNELGSSPAGEAVDLQEFIIPLMYEASSKAFFSPLFPSRETMTDFWAFDRFFPLLNLEQLPSIARRPAENAMFKLRDRLGAWYTQQGKSAYKQMAPAMQCMVDVGGDREWTEGYIGGLILSELWALEANAPFMGLWTISHVMRSHSLASSIRAEIASATASLSPPSLSTLYRLPPAELVAALPLCNAAFQESLRLYTESFSIRVVQEDIVIPAHLCAGGAVAETGFALKKGEQVICNTRPGAVDNGAWGRNATQWDAQAMLRDGKKGGMAPFGGGVSMCEGRHFASAEILAFIAIFMSTFDCEITQDTLHPELTRVGLGTRHPKGKMMVRMKVANLDEKRAL